MQRAETPKAGAGAADARPGAGSRGEAALHPPIPPAAHPHPHSPAPPAPGLQFLCRQQESGSAFVRLPLGKKANTPDGSGPPPPSSASASPDSLFPFLSTQPSHHTWAPDLPCFHCSQDPACSARFALSPLQASVFPSVRWELGNGNPLQYSCLENPMDGGAWWAAVHGVARSRTQLSNFTFHFPALEKAVATHSGVLAWRIPWTGEPGGLRSMGSQSRTRLK